MIYILIAINIYLIIGSLIHNHTFKNIMKYDQMKEMYITLSTHRKILYHIESIIESPFYIVVDLISYMRKK